MHHLSKKIVLALVVSSLIPFAFMLLVTTNTIANVSGVVTESVGVYWDSEFASKTTLIDWGTLTPGSVKSNTVYIRNDEVEEPIYLSMSTTKWDPSETSRYITLRWDYTRQRIDPTEVVQITLTLLVSRDIEGISNFSFDILIAGSQNLPGDINGNDRIDLGDVAMLPLIISGVITDPELVERGDINGDGQIGLEDVAKLNFIYSGIL